MENMSEKWKLTVGEFAAGVGKSLEEISPKLETLVGEPNDEGMELFGDSAITPDADIKKALEELKIPSAKFNKYVTVLRGPKKEIETKNVGATGFTALSILPAVPDDSSFIEMLKTGGKLKVEVTEVLSAVKAAFAKAVHLYDLPEIILNKMEEFSEKQEEPNGEGFYEMQKLLTEKKYGDVLAILNVPGSYISEKRKKEFFAKLDSRLWASLRSFHIQLKQWQESWMTGAASPAMLMMAMATKGENNAMAQTMMAPPDSAPLRASAEEVINDINRVFTGPGIPVARALAYDATRIMGMLNNPKLPAQIGVATKDQMIKELGINVGADIVRMEQSVTRYTLAIMSLPKVAAEEELTYFAAMFQLGNSIPWDKLGNGKAGLGKDLL
jgi:hypothetical protein